MWGVNLLSLSEIEIDVPDNSGQPTHSSVAVSGPTRTVNIKPRPFLMFLLQELGFSVSLTDNPLKSGSRLLIVNDLPAKVSHDLAKNLMDWVKRGNNLLIYVSPKHALFIAMGLDSVSVPAFSEAPFQDFPFFRDVKRITGEGPLIQKKRGVIFLHPLSKWKDPTCFYYGFRGRGKIAVLNSGKFFGPKGLQEADNVVFLVRLIDHLSENRSVAIFDPFPNIFLRSKVVSGKTFPIETKMKKVPLKYNSLWSLIKANPISWTLLQLFLSLGIYFFSISRRFSRPLPIKAEPEKTDSFLVSIGRRLAEMSAIDYSANQILQNFLVAARRKLGLPSQATIQEIADRFSVTHPQQASKLKSVLSRLNSLASQKNASSTELFVTVRNLEKIRKELKLHD